MVEVPSQSAMRRALRRARDGVTLDVAEAAVLLHARGDDLAALSESAGRVRDAGLRALGRPGVVTYSRKVFAPLTRLCRDRCHYCAFATTPGRLAAAGHGAYMSPDEVLEVARQGAALGCKELLLTLGDRPEDRWPAARSWLDEHGYDDTISYVRAMAIRVLEETGLLPHVNAGVLSWTDLQRLKPVAPSVGMMLETTARRLWAEPGGPHFGSPDKEPAVRLRVLTDAGRANVPITTGILIGIGESMTERAESLFAIRKIARQYGGVQEVIVQNFRAKPDTAMRDAPDADAEELAAAVAVARLVLGPGMRLQAPPNLLDDRPAIEQGAAAARVSAVSRHVGLLVRAGIDDWGGVSPLTPDHVNPERPWPQVEALAAATQDAGFTMVERLTVYPEYVRRGEPWLDARVAGHVLALADPRTGLAAVDARPVGRVWQEPDGGYAAMATGGRTNLHTAIDDEGRHTDRRGDFDVAYGDWDALREQVADSAVTPGQLPGSPGDPAGEAPRGNGSSGPGAATLDRAVAAVLRRAERDPAGISDADALTLFTATGTDLDAVCAFADDLRRDTVGDEVTYVVNRNVNFTNVCYTGCRFCAFAQRRTDADAYTLSLEQVGDRAAQAWAVGATEICMQGGIHPDLPGTAYFDLLREIKRRTPDMHIHAFSPMEVVNGAARAGMSIRDWLGAAKQAGLDTIPGTAAEILDDEVRWILTKGKLPTATWVEVITTAHELGLRSSATMMYGHVDTAAHWVAHLRLIAEIQDRTGGFTEFVPLPFVHQNAPVYLAGIARPGPTPAENRAVHALARVLLHGRVANIQTSWVKLGVVGARQMLAGGANDLGGTLMEETISRMAGSTHGSRKSVAQLEEIATGLGRPTRQRTTVYGVVDAERRRTALAADQEVVRPPLPVVS